MTTYVLLHGGAAGAWIWNFTEKALRAKGHEVRTVTFTGFAERNHLLSAECSIQLHVKDVVNTLKFHDIKDAVLVAHSYGGTVAPGVVAAAPAGSFRRVIYLDAIVLKQGESVAESMGMMSGEQAAGATMAIKAGAMPLEFPVAEQQRAEAVAHPHKMSPEREVWMLAHLSTMPSAASVMPAEVGAESIKLPVDYIAVSDTVMKPVMHDRARAIGWPVHEVEGDHAILVGDPDTTVALIERLSQ